MIDETITELTPLVGVRAGSVRAVPCWRSAGAELMGVRPFCDDP
jgi:hypothetical protein